MKRKGVCSECFARARNQQDRLSFEVDSLEHS